MGREHHYQVQVHWTGDRGQGTATYAGYGREHEIQAAGKPAIAGSSDAHFRGDPTRWNPEELLLAALSACHQLAYLHLCASHAVAVTAYVDEAEGWMTQSADGGGHFTRVLLKPKVTITAASDAATALRLHKDAHALCFIARSMNFRVEHEPRIIQT